MKSDKLNAYGLAFRDGDADAFQKIYEESYGWVRKEIIKRGIPAAEVEDCAQECYLHLYKKIGQFDPGKNDFRPWLNTLVKNRITDYYRAKHHSWETEVPYSPEGEEDSVAVHLQKAQMEAVPCITPETVLMQKEAHLLLDEMMESLSDLQRQSLVMRFYEEKKEKEVAEILHVAEGSVKSAVFVGKKKLKENILMLEKKHRVKLHGMAPLTFFLWVLSQTEEDDSDPAGGGARFCEEDAAQTDGILTKGGAASAAAEAATAETAAAESTAVKTTGLSVDGAAVKIRGTASEASSAAPFAIKMTGTKILAGVIASVMLVGVWAGVYYHHYRAGSQDTENMEDTANVADASADDAGGDVTDDSAGDGAGDTTGNLMSDAQGDTAGDTTRYTAGNTAGNPAGNNAGAAAADTSRSGAGNLLASLTGNGNSTAGGTNAGNLTGNNANQISQNANNNAGQAGGRGNAASTNGSSTDSTNGSNADGSNNNSNNNSNDDSSNNNNNPDSTNGGSTTNPSDDDANRNNPSDSDPDTPRTDDPATDLTPKEGIRAYLEEHSEVEIFSYFEIGPNDVSVLVLPGEGEPGDDQRRINT